MLLISCNNFVDFTSSSELLQITSPRVFDAQIPPETIYSLGGVTSLLFLTAYVWWTIVIPQQRTKLAVSKSRGKVKDFLDSISPSQESDAEASSDSRKKFLRWVFADWLQRRGSGGRVKDPALPFLKKSKWNSGDNPILVAFGAIMACVIAASIAERSF